MVASPNRDSIPNCGSNRPPQKRKIERKGRKEGRNRKHGQYMNYL
jgi:hypothetical protein